MARLLVVHHTPSPSTHAMLAAALDGAANDALDVEVEVRPALAATVTDALDADGYLLGTTANIGYMAGALKHWFDQIYYPCLEATAGRPFALYVHGNNDTHGAVRAVESIVGALKWRRVTETVEVVGRPEQESLDRLWNLGAVVAAATAGELR